MNRLRMGYRDQASALAAAKAELRKRARSERTMSYTFPGRPDVVAESLVVMKGFRDRVDGEWLVSRAEHYIGPTGYRCTIEAEQPNSADTVSQANGANVVDQVQPATAVG